MIKFNLETKFNNFRKDVHQMNIKAATFLHRPQIFSRSQKPFLTTLFIFTSIFEVLISHLILADLNQKLSEPPNLRVVQQRTAPDNFNIGVIHVKLKNWTTTTRFPRTSNKLHFILNETDNLEQKRRRNYEVGESRGRRTDGSQPNQGSNGGGSNGGMEMDALFPYLLLALGLALVAFFVILYAILNALLQRKDQHESVEQRRRRRKKRKKRRKREWRNDSNDLIERGKHFEDDEENSSEEKHLDSLDEEGEAAHPPLIAGRARWHRSRDGPDEELMERNDSDWMNGGGMRRYRQHRAQGRSGRRPPPPLPQLPPPPHEVPPRPRQLSQQHYPQHHTRGQKHIGWANEDQISLPGILRSTPRPPPPPPPRVPPPPPPLPARYQKRSRRQHEPSIENSSDDNDDQSSDGGNRRHRVYHKKHDQKRNNNPILPPQPLRRENTDSTVPSLQRGGRAGSL
ncbi:hypothetical protein ACQ4LE_008986 [Meloidogyne hapla]